MKLNSVLDSRSRQRLYAMPMQAESVNVELGVIIWLLCLVLVYFCVSSEKSAGRFAASEV